LFRDAGADYFLKDDTRSGGVTLDFETVYSQADKADFWRILNSYPGEFSYNALKAKIRGMPTFGLSAKRGWFTATCAKGPFTNRRPHNPKWYWPI
jgi:hypothetical protein